MEEQPRDEQAEPNDEAEETYDVHNGEPADAFFHKLMEVGHHTDGEEGQGEENGAQGSEGADHALAEGLPIPRSRR